MGENICKSYIGKNSQNIEKTQQQKPKTQQQKPQAPFRNGQRT